MAAGGQERELLLHGALELPAGAAEQGPVAAVEAELLRWVPDEVEDRAERLARRAAQAPAELLEEQRGALGGAQHEHGVDGGHVDALVEQVDGEHDPDLAGGQVPQGGVALVAAGCRPRRPPTGCRGAVKWRAMKRAWSMLTQKPRARIVAGSACSATCWTTRRAQASELV